MKSIRVLLILAAALVAAAVPAMAADDPPAWLKQAAAVKVPTYDVRGLPGVVLVDDATTTINDDGSTRTVGRWAVRILVHEGRGEASRSYPYVPNQSNVRELKAWLIRADGSTKSFGKNEIADVAASADDVYNEARARTVSAEDEADAGSVFGCEYTVDDRPLFAQDVWYFQERMPVLVSRLTLVMPAGWHAEGVTFNHDKVEPTVSGSTYSWELRDLKPIPHEPSGPPVTNMAPRLAYTYFAPEGKKAGQSFVDWVDVSRWATQLMTPQSAPNDAIAAKARELTSSASTEIDRVRAIGRFVQGVKYISIQTNLAHAGGMRPHPAADVFAKSYGDCKDKANLMVAMLKTLNVAAYPVVIYSGDPTYVRREWATPTQFNHCIVAVKVADAGGARSTIDQPPIGTLLVFDPTDTDTPVGDLPDYLQGSFALLVAGDQGGLVRMPETPPEANRLERETRVTLTEAGSVSGTISEHSSGQAAVRERRIFTSDDRAAYERRINRWIVASVSAAKVTKIAPKDDTTANTFALDVEFAADNYAQIMQGRLYVFKPALLDRLQSLSLTEPSRSQPVVLDGEAFTETASITLPSGFDVDETPDPVKLDTPFGTYATSYAVKDGKLVFTRALTLKNATLPVSDYATVRSFFEKVRAAEQAPVVLVRK